MEKYFIKKSERDLFLFDNNELGSFGKKNIENILAASAICNLIGIAHSKLPNCLKSFEVRPNRLEVVVEKNGVKYVNDSKSTNPHSLIHALQGYSSNENNQKPIIHLIAGGKDKSL